MKCIRKSLSLSLRYPSTGHYSAGYLLSNSFNVKTSFCLQIPIFLLTFWSDSSELKPFYLEQGWHLSRVTSLRISANP